MTEQEIINEIRKEQDVVFSHRQSFRNMSVSEFAEFKSLFRSVEFEAPKLEISAVASALQIFAIYG